MDIEKKGPIAEARELVEAYVRPEYVSLTEPSSGTIALFTAHANGVKPVPAEAFDPFRKAPLARRGTAQFLTIESLIEHANRFKDEGSVLFANNDRAFPSIISVLDYHPAGADSPPRFGRHRGAFPFPLSDEWKAWLGKNATPMPMAEFAEFLEDRIIDVLHLIAGEDELSEDLSKFIAAGGGEALIATPQRLVELSRGLQVNENSAVREVIKLASGETQMLFQSEHTDANGEPLRVPSLFLIAIPVFANGPLYRLAARLRYRKTPGGIVFWYDLWRHDRTFDHAFDESCERAKVETELPLLFGTPE